MRLHGTICAVTGASSGIGAAIARAFAAEGSTVFAFARRFRDESALAPGPGRITELSLDVTDEAQVKSRFGALRALDFLVCSHGTGTFAPIATAQVADLRAMLDTHVTGTFLCDREALRLMSAQRRGHIVNIASHAALRAFTECGAYTAAKAGQLGLTRVLAEEARPYGVRVTALMPGATDTPIWDDRPGFDRSKMMRCEDLASLVIELVTRPALAVDELVVTPPAGAL
ncbi:MAG TPA: SDR family oxidoreductase [Kofleriaceae bacterium]|nr:SDR family oxidoreductase [Kofleriaceae bacterium]